VANNEEIEGIRLPETEDWIGANTDEVEPPFEWSRLTGGTSNLTYAIRDKHGRRAVVRRPPTGKLLPKAHDMEREHKILFGLAPTPVPIARPFALCSDRDVTGAPFYVMEFREGVSIGNPSGAMLDMPMDVRPRIGESMIDGMVELHKIEPADVGLEDLGRPDSYVARQLNRWYDSFQRSDEAAQIPLPAIHKAFEVLSARIPEQGPARVCHGDYGVHNILIRDSGDVVAITDWEISTLGDPLADLCYFIRSWADESVPSADEFLDSRRDAGYASRRELISMYEAKSGRELKDLWFYIAFNAFKICCIVQGVYGRFRGGVRGTQGLNLDDMRNRILLLAKATERSIEQL
jgi:aminoglycoside phosphotransferase (APT) family kinase protein